MKTSRTKTRYGDMIVAAADSIIARSLVEYGEWTHSEMRLLEQVISPGMTVLDIGANVGCHTLAFSKAVGAGGKVVAFEPQPFMFQLLAANVANNGMTNVLLLNAAIGNAQGWIDLPNLRYEEPQNYGAWKLDPFLAKGGETPKNIPIPVHRLDDLSVARAADVIKIDVEGMESAVIEGARGLISARRPALFVENELPGAASQALLGLLIGLDYDLYWQIAPLFEEKNFRGNQQNHFGRITCVNVLGLPRERAVPVNGYRKVVNASEHPRDGVTTMPDSQVLR